MAVVCDASKLVAVVRLLRWSVEPWPSEAAGPTRRDTDGLVRLATVLRHRAAKACPRGRPGTEHQPGVATSKTEFGHGADGC